MLSPADADRPIPLPVDKSAPPPSSNSRGRSAPIPIVLPDGQLPPGFIPTTPSVPATPASRPNGIYASAPVVNSASGPSNHSTNDMPGGFPSMADQYMSLSTRRSFRDLNAADAGTGVPVPVPQPTTMPVIPPPSADYPYSDDDGASSSSSSANTLSTPPQRRQRLGRRTPVMPYASAPIPVPPGTVYPQAVGGAAIPVPPPRSEVGTPRSSGYGHEDGIYRAPGMSNQLSTPSGTMHSLHTSKSHKHFDKEGYLDPAFLANSSAEDVSVIGGRAGRKRR